MVKNSNWVRFLAIIIPYLFIVGFFQFLGYSLVGISFDAPDIEPTSRQRVVTTLFTLLGTVTVLLIFMKWVDKEAFKNLGLEFKGRGREFVFGLFLGAFIMIAAFFLLIALREIFFKEMVVNWLDIISAILVFTFVSFSEEMLIRGYVLRNFMSSFNKYVALILSSIIFSAMHLFNDNMSLISFIDLFLAGVLLGVSYIYTKNLWFPVALHLSWNLFQTLVGFNVSGHDFYSIIEFEKNENNLLNGGDFGFEGSVLSIIVQLTLIFTLFYYYEVSRQKKVGPI